MAWGYGTNDGDTEAYEGPQGFAEEVTEVPVVEEETPIDMETFLNSLKASDKFSFYLDDSVGQFGVRYNSSPFSANLNVGQGGQINWGAQVGAGTGLFNANVGIAGQGTSGSVSPFANLNVNPLPGLNFNLHGQSYPGGYSELNPSASYQNQFNTLLGPVDYRIGREGGRTVGGFQVRGDF